MLFQLSLSWATRWQSTREQMVAEIEQKFSRTAAETAKSTLDPRVKQSPQEVPRQRLGPAQAIKLQCWLALQRVYRDHRAAGRMSALG